MTTTPEQSRTGEPKPQTFFEDLLTGELYFYLGKDTTPGVGGYVFQTSRESVQRRMSLDMIHSRLKLVNPSDPGYRFASVRDVDLHKRYAQSSPSHTDLTAQEIEEQRQKDIRLVEWHNEQARRCDDSVAQTAPYDLESNCGGP